jgi:hypothetical protein
VRAALKSLEIAPDFEYSGVDSDHQILSYHRKLADGEIYFVDNRSDKRSDVTGSFRGDGRSPELWYAESGKMTPASYNIAEGRTNVPLHLEPWGSVFVVFRERTKVKARALPDVAESSIAEIGGPWTISFQPGRGAPPTVELDHLISWTDSRDQGVKYFSGIGRYTKTIDAPADWFKNGSHLWIDLGDVHNLAEIKVNGNSLGIAWHVPFRLDATSALHAGTNTIEIDVINAWVNRLIGDQQPDAATKYTVADTKPYTADSPLQVSGLLGPVRIVRTEEAAK